MRKEVYRTQLQLKRKARSVSSGLVTGLATLLTLSSPSHARYRSDDINHSLRGDFVRIGGDMREAMRKERTR